MANFKFLSYFLFVIFCKSIFSSEIPIENGVYVLTIDTFDEFLKSKDVAMVEFYSPGCGHCKKLEPEYAKAAKDLVGKDVVLAKVDATVQVNLARQFRIQGFPTMIIFRNGEFVENYDGVRTSRGIVNHLMALKDPDWIPPPSDVTALSGKNFSDFVTSSRLSVVMFYAPWCGHCKQAMPEFEAAASELKDWGISIGKVDGTTETELAEKYNVEGWPTFKVFRKGHVFEYKGSREKSGIVAYMKEQAKPPSEEKTHKMSISNNLDRHEISVVGFFTDKSDFYNQFMLAANEFRGTFKFLHTFRPEAAADYKVPADSVAVFMPEIYSSLYEDKVYTLTDTSASYKDIVAFIRERSVPLVGQRSKQNMFKYSELPLIVVYFDVSFDHQFIADTQYVRKKVLEVAKDYSNTNLKFAISNEEDFSDELGSLGLDDSGSDINVACFTDTHKFRMEPVEEFEVEDLKKFVEDMKEGRIAPFLKSQPIPKGDDASPVKVVVANSYDKEIKKVNKDAVLFVHAPWCGHCKEFDPTYKKFAKKTLKSNENIIFAKIDGTANDLPLAFPPVKGFPTIFFISASNKNEPVQYQGDRSAKSLKEWVDSLITDFSKFDGATIDEAQEDQKVLLEVEEKKNLKDEL